MALLVALFLFLGFGFAGVGSGSGSSGTTPLVRPAPAVGPQAQRRPLPRDRCNDLRWRQNYKKPRPMRSCAVRAGISP